MLKLAFLPYFTMFLVKKEADRGRKIKVAGPKNPKYPKSFCFFKQLSSQIATFDCFLSNDWEILGNFLENLEQLVESPEHDSEAFWSFFYIWVGFLFTQDNAGSCEKSAILSPKPRSHDWIFIYRTWAIIMDGPWKAEGLCQLRFNSFWLQSFSHERQ